MIRTALVALAAALGAAGCSPGGGSSDGSGGGGLESFVPSGDSPAGDPSFAAGTQAGGLLLLLAAEGDGTVRDASGAVDLGSGAVTGALIAGQLDAGRARIALAGGGVIDLENPAGTEYVRRAAATTAGASYFGVLGLPSLPSDLPASGGVSYSGRAELLAVDAFDRYDLEGAAFVGADFGAGRVRIELFDLAGTRQGLSGPSAAPEPVSGGRIVVSDSAISGATFAGGRASSSGLPFLLSRDADASGTRGAFFGPGADEVGGRIGIADLDAEVIGTFVAE